MKFLFLMNTNVAKHSAMSADRIVDAINVQNK